MRNWILKDLGDDELIEAIERNSLEHKLFFPARHPEMDVILHEDFIVIDSKMDSSFLNHAYARRLNMDNAEERIKTISQHFIAQKRSFSWTFGPSICSDSLRKKFKSVGDIQESKTHCLILQLEPFKQKLRYIPDFHVQQVLTRLSMQHVAQVYGSHEKDPDLIELYFNKLANLSFHAYDPMKYYVGYLGEEPVIVGELFLGAGIAGLRCKVRSKVQYLEKELMADLTFKMLFQAYHQGYHWSMIKVLPEQVNYFQQLGFKRYCEFFHYQ